MEPIPRAGSSRPRRQKGPSLLSLISPPEDEEELRLVMQEIATAFGATAIILTVQEDDHARCEILRTSAQSPIDSILPALHDSGAFLYDEQPHDCHSWKNETVAGVAINIMIVPVKRSPGHRRMVLCAIFSNGDKNRLAAAERVYLARRPFAIGYFRLWQTDRARQRREKALEAGLNSLGVGFVLIDDDSRIVFANIVALELLELGDGLKLTDNRIFATNLTDSMRLRTVLEHVSAPNALTAPMLAITRALKVPLTLLALPMAFEATEIGSVAAAIYIIDPIANVDAVIEPLCHIYQLTASEKKLACLLATGKNLAEAAEEMNVKAQTVRSVLKQIFRKTGTSRQAEFVMLMFSSIVRVHNSVRIEGI